MQHTWHLEKSSLCNRNDLFAYKWSCAGIVVVVVCVFLYFLLQAGASFQRGKSKYTRSRRPGPRFLLLARVSLGLAVSNLKSQHIVSLSYRRHEQK